MVSFIQSCKTCRLAATPVLMFVLQRWPVVSNVFHLNALCLLSLQAGKSSLQSDMQLCRVVFSNLTTLSLSDWCLHGNCEALFYFFEHSPNLEELTLKMRKQVSIHSILCTLADKAISIP